MHLKVSMSGLRHKTDMADEQVSNLADRLGEIFQNYKRQSREIKKKKKGDIEDKSRSSQLCKMGISEEEKRKKGVEGRIKEMRSAFCWTPGELRRSSYDAHPQTSGDILKLYKEAGYPTGLRK